MAKAKKKSSTKKKSSPPVKSKTMSTPKKRKKKSTSAVARRRRPAALPVPRRKSRRKKGLFDATGSGIKTNAIHAGAGFVGGSLYGAGVHLLKIRDKKVWAKALLGIGTAMTLGMIGMPFVAAGSAGAMGSDIIQQVMDKGIKSLLNDGEMDDVEWVHPSTLSDSGLIDDEGNELLMDADGMCYGPDEEGTYHPMGNIYELSEGTDLQSVSMLPLEHNNPYNLASGY